MRIKESGRFIEARRRTVQRTGVGRRVGVLAAVPFAVLDVFAICATTRGEEEDASPQTPAEIPKPVDGIRDNSFFVEEAYNQEAGVVQHIFTARWGADHRGDAHARSWDLSFTQEWPVVSQRHQVSYTLPYSFVDEDREHTSGLGDILINYRYQWLTDEGTWPAIAPRVSFILPSGDEDRGFGDGVCGFQLNLPISKTVSDRVYLNLNGGLTYLPDVEVRKSNGRDAGDYDLLSYNLAGSVIYAVTDTFHLLLEAVWNANAEVLERDSAGGRRLRLERKHSNDVVISPGVRWAHNLSGGIQIVPGIALPIGVSEDAIDYGVFFYLSIEHSFRSSTK